MCWINKKKSKPISLCSSRLNQSLTITTEQQQSEATFAKKNKIATQMKKVVSITWTTLCVRLGASGEGQQAVLLALLRRGLPAGGGAGPQALRGWWGRAGVGRCAAGRAAGGNAGAHRNQRQRKPLRWGRRRGWGRGLQLPPGWKRQVLPPRWNLFLSLFFNHQVLNRFSFSIPFHPKQEVSV